MRDINTRAAPSQSLPRNFVRVGSNTFFSARTAASGRELWRTDGSAAGTSQLTEIVAGLGDANPEHLTAFGQQLLFVAGDARQSLWSSDGTVAGTRRLRSFDSAVAIAPQTLPGLALVATRNELWRTDGTVAGTTLVSQATMAIEAFTSARVGNELLFTRGDEVWRTDGTAAGTRLLSPRFPFSDLVTVGNQVYFGAADGLRSYDGATVRTVAAGSPTYLVSAVGGTVFWGQGQLFSLDTQVPGAQPRALGIPAYSLQPVGARMGILSDQNAIGPDVWLSDGTPAGTSRVLDLEPTAIFGRMFALGAQLMVSVQRGQPTAARVELWSIAGTPAQATMLAAMPGGRLLDSFAADATQQRGWFAGASGSTGVEPWVTDGTAGGTRLLRDLEATPATESAYPHGLQRLGSAAFCTAYDGVVGGELWRIDGAGAGLVADLEPGSGKSSPRTIGSHAGHMFFVGSTDGTQGLWSLAETRGALPRRLVAYPFKWYSPLAMAPLDATRAIVFVDEGAEYGAYVTDGRTALRLPVAADAGPQPISIGGQVFFAGLFQGQRELFVTDGTGANTRVIDLNGGNPSFVGLIARLGSELLFFATDFANGGLHITDGTRAGTRFIAAGDYGEGLTLGDRVLMLTAAQDGSVELRVTDGTTAGTGVVANLGSSLGLGRPAVLGGRALLPTANGLWASDGTAAGTVPLAVDVAVSGEPANTGAVVVWRTGSGVYASDGTAAGSRLLATSGSDVTSDPLVLDHRLLFARDHVSFGVELFGVDIGASAVTNGLGCGVQGRAPSLRTAAPRLGAGVGLELTDLSNTGAAALLVAPRAVTPLAFAGGRCAFCLDLAGAVILPPRAFTGGRLAMTLTVPATPQLDRLPLAVQAAIAAPLGLEVSNGVDWTLGW